MGKQIRIRKNRKVSKRISSDIKLELEDSEVKPPTNSNPPVKDHKYRIPSNAEFKRNRRLRIRKNSINYNDGKKVSS